MPNPEVDEAITYQPALEAFLNQGKSEKTGREEGYNRLAAILEGAGPRD